MPESATRFVLKRLNWTEYYGGTLERQPGARVVASFDTFDAAAEECAKRENEVREVVNPFACGAGVHFWSHLDEPRLRDWLMDRGIDPPKAKKDGTADWVAWWKKHSKALSDEKRASVWEVLDKVRFYAVIEEPVRKVGYAVVNINWEYNDQTYDAHADQGEVMQVFRTRERAEQECADCNDIARDVWSEQLGENDDEIDPDDTDDMDDNEAMFDMRERVRRRLGLFGSQKLKDGEGVFHKATDAVFYEVIEIPVGGAGMSRKPVAKKKAKTPPKPLKVFIVVREMARVNNSFTEPDRVFATKKDALAHAKHMNRELRVFTNPFADQHEPGFIMSEEDDLFALLKTFKIPKPKPPKGGYVKWDQWWAQIMPELTEEQRDAVWDKFDEFDWYKVKETTLED